MSLSLDFEKKQMADMLYSLIRQSKTVGDGTKVIVIPVAQYWAMYNFMKRLYKELKEKKP